MTMATRPHSPALFRREASPGLWGITSFFNPTKSQRRLANYREFRQALRVPLVAVELAFGPSPELQTDDAEVLLCLRGQCVLWQKERLLNLALQAVPPECDAVAWLDCDVVFQRDDWPVRAREQLEHVVLVQPFQDVQDSGPPARIDPVDLPSPSRHALAYQIARGRLSPDRLPTAPFRQEQCAAGLSWVARRELLQRHGFYDAAIVGGGDRALICAAFGRWEGLEDRQCWNAQQRQHYLAWARPFFARVQGRVGYLEGGIRHLWHGDIPGRGYRKRFEGLAPFGFDPYTDIALDEQGCWRWNSAKTELHQYVKQYFELRREDG
jgi:hypothetical protein